ncbi:MAG TPA: RpiB/LacA/LacB family sugar-phosphate isomerase [Candidatus Saccharimonadales bacterium]|nr:RpiB/LacA/LacB family sugar-phosphate isomerase [Candidatus Saccharimonadales bacterium]
MLFLASDHAGYELKEHIHLRLHERGVAFEDFGTFSEKMDDFPGYALRVAKEVVKHHGRGILVCGSGHGMTIVANRFKGVRAITAWNAEAAKRGREEEDANILSLPARLVTNEEGWEIVSTFLATSFAHLDRYKRRIEQTDAF